MYFVSCFCQPRTIFSRHNNLLKRTACPVRSVHHPDNHYSAVRFPWLGSPALAHHVHAGAAAYAGVLLSSSWDTKLDNIYLVNTEPHAELHNNNVTSVTW